MSSILEPSSGGNFVLSTFDITLDKARHSKKLEMSERRSIANPWISFGFKEGYLELNKRQVQSRIKDQFRFSF